MSIVNVYHDKDPKWDRMAELTYFYVSWDECIRHDYDDGASTIEYIGSQSRSFTDEDAALAFWEIVKEKTGRRDSPDGFRMVNPMCGTDYHFVRL